jgi:NitT/TauT family transport system substrate-binding protein
MSTRRVRTALATLLLLVCVPAGCAHWDDGSGDAADRRAPGGTVTIGYQPGFGYAQLLIMKQERWLEEALGGRRVEYRSLGSGADIREEMVAGEIQIGAGGIGPFLVGYDTGADWKLLSALGDADLWLVTEDPRLTGLAAFEPTDRIAVPGRDSIQAVVLRRAAQEQLGDAAALDANMVELPHPDALERLQAGTLAAHMSSPPFQFQAADASARKLLGSADVFGRHTFNSVFVQEAYHAANRDVTDAVYAQIERATALINEDPEAAAAILSAESRGRLTAAEAERWLTDDSVAYTTEPHGFMAFATFMQDIGLVEEAPSRWHDVVFDNLKHLDGS